MDFFTLLDFSVMPAFLVAVLVILVAPGPDMVFMVASGLTGGRKGATQAAFGITLGVSVYVVITALGLAAMLTALPSALFAIKAVGACYLLYLAYTTWKSSRDSVEDHAPTKSKSYFRQGFVVNITNPKIAIFFVAFLPQFLGNEKDNPTFQLLLLGFTLQLCGLLVDLAIGFAAGLTKDKLLSNPKIKVVLNRISAGVYGALGLGLIVEGAKEVASAN
jgi:threonine/homoserine/homoserine lactone efflux protein